MSAGCIPLQAHPRPAGCTPDTPLRSAGCTPAMHPHTGQLGVPLPPFREEFDIMFDCPGVKYLEWLRFPNRHLWTASQPLQPCNFQNWIIREEWSEHVLRYHGAVSWVWAMFFFKFNNPAIGRRAFCTSAPRANVMYCFGHFIKEVKIGERSTCVKLV